MLGIDATSLMADPGPSPEPEAASAPRRRFLRSTRLHPPSLALGLLLGGLCTFGSLTLWQRQRSSAPAGSLPAPAAAGPELKPAAPTPRQEDASAPEPRASAAAERNPQIDALLNSADVAFRAKMEGCPAVSLAIRLAREPDDILRQGRIHPAQEEEIRRYAARCGLRF